MTINKPRIELLKLQLQNAHETLEGTIEGVTETHAHSQPPGTAHAIGATYAHLVMSEDVLIHGVLTGKKPLGASSWQKKTGASEFMPPFDANWEKANKAWSKRVRVNMAQLRKYAKSVYAASLTYLSGLAEKDLDGTVDLSQTGMGKPTRLHILSSYIVGHAHDVTGEISALKGIQGLKGYPF